MDETQTDPQSLSEPESSGEWRAAASGSLFKPGAVIAGRYHVLRQLGAGGMGWVVQARDDAFAGQHIALKILYPHLLAHEVARARFRNEVLVSRRLSHPAIVQTYAFDTAQDGSSFISMEYVAGKTLAKRIAESEGKGLEFAEALEIFCRIAGALVFAHQQGIIHRDLKSENVLLGAENEVKVADFGLAQALRQETRLTRVGDLLGTPYYMSPEQFRGERLTFCSDIYSLGIVFYEMLQGRLPFDNQCIYELARSHTHEALPPLAGRGAGVPPWVDPFLLRCCAKQPEDRFESMNELLGELRSHAGAMFKPEWIERGLPVRIEAPTPPAGPKLNLGRLLLQGILFGLTIGVLFSRTNSTVRWRVAGHVLKLESFTGWSLQPLKWLLKIELELDSDAIFSNKRELVLPLLIAGRSPNEQDRFGRSALHRAVVLGESDLRLVNALLMYGARVDLADKGGYAPLHLAAAFGGVHSVERLIAAHAPVNAASVIGDTPLHIAAVHQNPAALRALLQAGADPNLRTIRGETPLHKAAEKFDEASIIALLASGSEVNAQNIQGETPLIKAVRAGIRSTSQIEAIRLLVAHGARLELRDSSGRSAYDYAKSADAAMLLNLLSAAPDKEMSAPAPIKLPEQA